MSPSSKAPESIMKIYVATHCRNDEELSSRKIIGIFSSQESAHAAVDAIAEELEELESIDYPDLFTVVPYDLDEPLLRHTARAQFASERA
jgi:hypothetical protein